MQVTADQLAAFAEKTQLEEALRRTRAALAEAEAERDQAALGRDAGPDALEH
jgi:hypothetical protein